jgi:E3 ubiquitin-protein ligase RNF5
VCKAAVSPDALVPLYGRGRSSRAKKPPRGPASSIPRRPALRQSVQDSGNGGGNHHHRNVETDAPAWAPPQARRHADAAQYDALLPPPFGDRGMMHSTAGGVLGGMAVAVLAWLLRGQPQPPGMYYSSPYHLMNPRQRRRHMEVERSLHHIWFFLFVFVLLCLLLF